MTGWLGATLTHGISENHITHHVAAKIPHYHSWDASAALRARLARDGYDFNGGPGTWGEVVRVYRACKVCVCSLVFPWNLITMVLLSKFVEDKGDVIFYKNARGLAQWVGVFRSPAVKGS